MNMTGVKPTLGKTISGLCNNDKDFEEMFRVVSHFVESRFKQAFMGVECSVKAILQDLLFTDATEGTGEEPLACEKHIRPFLREYGIYEWGEEGT